ncbi:MAG: carbohydrate binding domain-containing protein [Actinobacteria bacterium]|nr:carbohydrate binding domain-containing protein [Actinomycetota bacterium]
MANQIAPGTFEGGTESWFNVGATIAQSTAQAHSGTHSLAVTGKGGGSFEGAGKDVTLESGVTEVFKVWVYRESGKKVRLFAQHEGGTDTHETTVTAAATGWAEYKLEFSPSSSGTYEVEVRFAETTTTTLYVDDASLEPKAEAPAVTTEAATGLSNTHAELNATVNPKGTTTTYLFEYGTSESLGSSTSSASGGEGSSGVARSTTVTGLTANTKYYFRVSATNTGGTTHGSVLNFTTLNRPTVRVKAKGGSGATPVFSGSFSGGHKSEWELEQAPPAEHSPPAEPGMRVTVVNAESIFPGSGLTYCGKFEFQQGDAEVPPNAGQRSELQRPNPYCLPNNHYWFKEWFRADEWDKSHYVLNWQLHEDEPATGVAVGQYIEGTSLKLKPGVGTSWWVKTLEAKVAYQIKRHVYISETAGIIEVWLNGEKQTLQNGSKIAENQNTLSPSTSGGGTKKTYEKVGINRSRESTGTTLLYHGGILTYEGATDPDTAEGAEWVTAVRYSKASGIWVAG